MRLIRASLTQTTMLAATMLAACGGNAQRDVSLSDVQDTEQSAALAGGAELERLYDDVTWYFQCPTEPVPVPTPGSNSLVLVDAGPHPYLRQRLVDVPVTVKGKICPTERMNRDAIFVIDVSGSMGYSTGDPVKPIDPTNPTGPKSCGRMDALDAIIDRLPTGTANFGVVTFDSTIQKSSTRLFNDKNDLIRDLTNNGATPLIDVICAAIGGTNYAQGLEKARQLFMTSRQYATKEIYFLSDGEPADTTQAVAKANELKNVGIPINGQNKTATIATVMLGGSNDTVLRTQIASHDVSGQPIHAVAGNAADLARILDGLADNHLEGSHLKHGGTSSTTPTTIDVIPYMDPTTREFTLPPMVLDIDLRQNSYDLQFEYWDSHRNRFTIIGKLNWQDHN